MDCGHTYRKGRQPVEEVDKASVFQPNEMPFSRISVLFYFVCLFPGEGEIGRRYAY